jgi:hypothetical protein
MALSQALFSKEYLQILCLLANRQEEKSMQTNLLSSYPSDISADRATHTTNQTDHKSSTHEQCIDTFSPSPLLLSAALSSLLQSPDPKNLKAYEIHAGRINTMVICGTALAITIVAGKSWVEYGKITAGAAATLTSERLKAFKDICWGVFTLGGYLWRKT